MFLKFLMIPLIDGQKALLSRETKVGRATNPKGVVFFAYEFIFICK
jgi:hypothetical protein